MMRIAHFILVATLLVLPCIANAATITVDEQACGSRQSLKVGDELVVRLPGNPTTGYVWEATAVPPQLIQQGKPSHRGDSKLVGAAGVTSFVFKVDKAGDNLLELTYRRQWEQNAPSLKHCRIQLNSFKAVSLQPAGKKIGQDSQGTAIYQVQANGISIGYKLIGSGEPLVMIMGLGGTMDRWHSDIVAALAKRYQLIILDNRGMGFSTANDTVFSYQLFADDVIALLDALKVQETHVLGYSMGSTITQKLLLEYPQRFNKAVIHATSTDGSNVAKALQGQAANVPPTVIRQLEATTHWRTPLERLPAIKNQVMLIVGTADTTVGAESSKTIASAIPGAWLIQFKNATHHLMYEAPTSFTSIVMTFLGLQATVEPK